MVDIITAAEKEHFRSQLDAMFMDRRRVFVDLLKWDLPVNDGGFEIDQFDDDEAIYFVMSDLSKRHMGSLRLLRTLGPHILGELFPHLCEDGVPSRVDIYEITRLCLCPDLPASERLCVRNRLISAMVDYALVHRIQGLTGVVAAHFLRQILSMGWRCQALGPLHRHGAGRIGAFYVDVDEATPRLLQATRIYVPNHGAMSTTHLA
jgi:N-acyl-L-homoserine lactone synthetase